ncbi:MAG: VCBS repeat-containing protein [Planctomycetota bacterium]|nr:VCBS repeat-containing protein [Planctomycetota bacterium]
MGRPKSLSALLLLSAATLIAGSARAQFNNQWVEFEKDPLAISSGTISNSSNETDMAWGDLDQDGWTDLVIVRKEPFTSSGKRTNILLMNESGVLTNRTSTYATSSSVGGDQGFNTPTNDRDVILTDTDQDGWLDVVTATTLSDGNAKHIGHPRVYVNQAGSWGGLRFEDNRFPQLKHYGTGNNQNPRFCSVAAGDVTGNGYPDLYFGDYDSSGAGGQQQGSNEDLNDRLLINDGNGFYADESLNRMTSQMLSSAFGNSVVIADFNGNGHNDIVKDTALNAPQYVAASYNNPNSVGNFNIFHSFHTNAPYHTSAGDLNKDGRIDLVISDDGSDRMRINTGTDALGRVVWSSALTFDFLSGGDDGFASNNLVVDLDGDGWNDVLICDVDVDIGSYSRRLHIYHNKTTQVGASSNSSITMVEERQSSSSSAWLGVVGMKDDDLEGTHDVAVFDVDNDGDQDMVVSRLAGTDVWKNLTAVPLPEFGTPFGVATPSSGGDPEHFATNEPTAPGTLTLATRGVGSSTPFFVGLSVNQQSPALDLSNGLMLNVALPLIHLLAGSTDVTGLGIVELDLPAAASGLSIFTQAFTLDGTGGDDFAVSPGLQLDID